MIPVPPFDGSRILYVFLPPKYYFKVMKYERYIGIGILLAFIIASRFNIDLLGFVVNPIMDGIYWLVGLG
jgi:Zn-dependent protease